MQHHKQPDSGYWDNVVRNMEHSYHIDNILCLQKKAAYLDLITQWADLTICRRLLKTDLFEESVGKDDLLFDLSGQVGSAVGIDISSVAAAWSSERARRLGIANIECVCSDVRKLPFKSASFDLIVSNSTLDHFRNKIDIQNALEELWRILAPGGTFILTMDNKSNWSDPFFRLWIRLGLAPYFSGHTYNISEANRILGKLGFSVRENTAIIHNPRLVTRCLASLLYFLNPARAPAWINKGLKIFNELENSRIKYFTGLYIAVKAVKQTAVSESANPC